MEIGASLTQVELFASDAQALSAFYASTFGLDSVACGASFECSALERQIVLVPGEGGQLRSASFRFHDVASLRAHRKALAARSVGTVDAEAGAYAVCDPEGRSICFLPPATHRPLPVRSGLVARLQHFAVRTPAPQALVDFYVSSLGFVLSDRVLDDAGDMTAAFMRTDSEHHSMAIFKSPTVRFDHFSCEAPGWNHLRVWADHMSDVGVDLAWGIGRHGPGNDTFLMVRDADGNMGEVSCDLEVCTPGRPVGTWPHRPQTLNRWGVAIMRI